MTTEEATYFKEYIERRLSELLAVKSDDEKQELRIKDFAERYMQTITGQDALPQSTFRMFLDEFYEISGANYDEATEEDILDMFNNTGGDTPPEEEYPCDYDEVTNEDIDNLFPNE